ncbi:MAG: hypothetical protein K1X64_13670 [Myxococcaceae bacterium]|nr:hypothetical protein [Myxococcaceae bacterium]
MESSNRLALVNTTFDVPRQTPKHSFGQAMAAAANGVVRVGDAIASAVPGVPVLSTAISAVVSLANANTPPAMVAASRGTAVIGNEQPLVSAADDGLNGTLLQMRQQSAEYLAMQNAMQQESREYNALSNIIKVRHDSAKAAIGNIR